MLRFLMLAPVLLGIVVLALLAVGIHYLGFFSTLAIALGLGVLVALAVKILFARLLRRLMLAPFKMKGAVLRDAEAEVHRVEPLAATGTDLAMGRGNADADGDAADTADDAGRVWYRVEATITPRPAAGKFTHWEPDELRIVPLGSGDPADDDDADTCAVREVETIENGEPERDGVRKYVGPKRVRMTVGVRRGAANPMVFRYYFEDFGEVSFPDL